MGEVNGVVNGVIEEEERVHEWEAGLPNIDDITPLNHGLISPELLSAFNIKPEPYRSNGDLSRACQDTISSIRGQSPATNFKSFNENQQIIADDEEIDDDSGGGGEEAQPEDDGSDTKKPRRNKSPEDADSAAAKTLKRPRLVWTPQLHKRFVDVVTHLGIKNAVPKTIMQLMNVEGLTRENVASHLQKYRLYLKRMQGVSFDAPSSSSPAAPLPAPENLMSSENGSRSGSGNGNGPVPMPYAPTPMMPVPMPMMGMGMGMGNFNGFESHHNHYNFQNHHHHHHHQYNNGSMQSGSGTKYGSVVSYHQHHHHHPPHVAPGDK